MKKVIFGLLLLFVTAAKVSAQTDTTGTRYWYYPSQNYYYNDVSGDYWFYDQPTTKWMEAKKLPETYKMSDTDDRYTVYYNGPDVWRENKTHVTKYKVKKNGDVKQKSTTGN